MLLITTSTRDKYFLSKNDEDIGMKKAQKQDIIQGILYPFLHSTQYYSHIIDHSLSRCGM